MTKDTGGSPLLLALKAMTLILITMPAHIGERGERDREGAEESRKTRGRHAEESRKSREKVLDSLWAGKHMLNLIARIGGSP